MSEKQHYQYPTPEDRKMYESSYLKIDEAHERAKGVLEDNEIKLDMFSGLYDEDILERDTKEVERLEGIFEQSPSKIHADILEAIVCEHGELSNWFGSESQVIKTSRFDDYINKIDMVVETVGDDRGYSHLALGIDVTFGNRDLYKKFDAIRANIDNGTLGEVKYFHSDRQHVTGRLRKVPQIVIGVAVEKVRELGLLWMNRKNKELSEHSVQVTILEEAALQLNAFAEYARKSDGEGAINVAQILEKELQKIHELLEEKKKRGLVGIKDDKVFEEIKRNLLSFTKE